MTLSVCLFSWDKGPGKNLEILASELKKRGHQVRGSYFESPVEPEHFLSGCHVLVTGMSTKAPEHELALTRAAQDKEIPVIWLSDTHLAFNRPAFARSGVWPTSITVCDQHESVLAMRVGYPMRAITGLPLWESVSSLQLDLAVVRSALKLDPIEKLVLYVMGKDSTNNAHTCDDLFFGLSELAHQYKLVLWPRFHPGDPHHPSKGTGFYGPLLDRMPFRVVYSDGDELGSTDALVLASDVVFGSHTGAHMAAIFHRRAAIDYLPPYVIERLEKLNGTKEWPPAELGATCKISAASDIPTAFRWVFSEHGLSVLRESQDKHYPIPESGTAVRKLAQEVERVVLCK